MKTSEDAAKLAAGGAARSCGGCAAPFRNYSSVLSYLLGFGWLLDAVGANAPAGEAPQLRIRRSMSSRIAVDAGNDDQD